jgi:hypothetical protein
MLGDLNSKHIEQVLHSLIIGRIGCHADNRTYVVPVTYAYDGTYIYEHTTAGLKIDMMRKNPMGCFDVLHKQVLQKLIMNGGGIIRFYFISINNFV